MNVRKIVAVVIMDALLLGELTLAIYLGSRDMATMTETFLAVFLPPAIVTIIAGRMVLRRLEAGPEREPAAGS